MAPTTPHLLTLPREIRNHIYEYLFQETPFEKVAIKRTEVHQVLEVRIRAHNCPLLNVLLVHSRIRDEYLEAPCFKELSATIITSSVYQDASRATLLQERLDDFRLKRIFAKQVLCHTKHLTIHHIISLKGIAVDIRAFTLQTVIGLIAPDLLSLRSIRLATRTSVGTIFVDTARHLLGPVPRVPYATPNQTFRGLPLVQHGRCYGVRANFSMEPMGQMIYHSVDIITFEVYTADKADSLLWGEEVAKGWRLSFLPPGLLAGLSEQQAKRLKELPERAFVWSAERLEKT